MKIGTRGTNVTQIQYTQENAALSDGPATWMGKREKSKGNILLVYIHPLCNDVNTRSDLKWMALRHSPALCITCKLCHPKWVTRGTTWLQPQPPPNKSLPETVMHNLSLYFQVLSLTQLIWPHLLSLTKVWRWIQSWTRCKWWRSINCSTPQCLCSITRI